ncbi:MAG: TonB-dependent siderophore receptor [Phenylobacterium sp.]|nr:TonB-dependent siderophore receptor [Phenylobacterium sp.]
MKDLVKPALLAGAAWSALAGGAWAEEGTVEELVVTGRAQRLYRTVETTVGKIAETPLDIPQSIQVLNADLIADQGARDITDLYRNIAGVTTFAYSGVTFRGFRQDEVYYDSVRGNPFNAFSTPQLFNIERVEVLKGPAGMLYGPGSPGGLINYVTKTPGEARSLEASATVGSYDRRGVSLAAEGRIAGPVLGRLGGFYEEMKPFRRNSGSEIRILDGGLTIELGERAQLVLQSTRYDQALQGNRLRGVPADNSGAFLTDISWNHNEASDYLVLGATTYQARLSGEIGARLSGDLTVRSFDSSEKQQYHEPFGLVDTDRDGQVDATRRQFRDQVRRADGLALAGNLRGEFETGPLTHRVLAGGDWYRENAWSYGRSLTAGVPNLSLRNPVYGVVSSRTYNLLSVAPSYTDSTSLRWGAYIQDQIAFGERWIVVGGVRFDRFEDEDKRSRQVYADDDLTFRAGVIYKARPDLSVYASWSEGFEPQAVSSQSTVVGGPFAPVTGQQIEAGVKAELLDGRIQANAAVFEIVRENLLQIDPTRPPVNGRDQMAPIGEVTSRGFETDLSVDVTPNWVVTANYAYNHVRVTKSAPGRVLSNAVGDRFANAPAHEAGFWTRYQIAAIDTAIAFGGEYVGERISIDGQQVKPYTIFDVSIIKTFGPVRAMLRIDNLFDKTYAASGFITRSGHFPGEPRSVFLELRTRFGG